MDSPAAEPIAAEPIAATSREADRHDQPPQRRSARRHDLDAVRGTAMLLGIVLHGALSFVPGNGAMWPAEDSQADPRFAWLIGFLHGWRMPLFFLVSGFFTAMLWQRRGTRGLIGHRARRIVLPMLLALVTVVPLFWAEVIAIGIDRKSRDTAADETDSGTPVDPTPLLTAAAVGDLAAVGELIAAGHDLEERNERCSTPLHVAVFFGRPKIAAALLEAGADPTLTDVDGKRPQDMLAVSWKNTSWIAQLVQIPLDRETLIAGRAEAATLFETDAGKADARKTDDVASDLSETLSKRPGWEETVAVLQNAPLFLHLWFLWYLCWLVAGFVAVVPLARRIGLRTVPSAPFRPGWRLAWLIPLTAVFHLAMDQTAFGPQTAAGPLPVPAILGFYAIYFAFGAGLFAAEDRFLTDRTLSWGWAVSLLLGVALFPIAHGLWEDRGSAAAGTVALAQSAYGWLMTFGILGLFRRVVATESRTMRYLSDSSYWLYLIHIPVLIPMQYAIEDWPINGWLKFAGICLVASGLLLASYQLLVRNTSIGVLLNGRRGGTEPPPSSETVAVNANRATA